MCDSLVAVGSATADGSLVFGKNSDRPAAEEQRPIYCPARRHPTGARVRCTYIWMTWGDNPCEADFREMSPPLPAGCEDRIVRYGSPTAQGPSHTRLPSSVREQ